MIKHVGVHKNLGTRYVIVFREVPNEPGNCLVVESDSLNALVQDNLMSAIESSECQTSSHLGEALARKTFATGENMLQYLHANNLMRKIPVADVLLTPTPGTRVSLKDVNDIINGVTPESTETIVETPVTAETINSQINDSIAQAKKLLEQAIALDPSLVGQVIQGPAKTEIIKKPRRRRQQQKA